LVHMGCWATLFMAMWTTGFVEAPHPGNSLAFWQQAYARGVPHAGPNLLKVATYLASLKNAGASNVVGEIFRDGRVVKANDAVAVKYFVQAFELGQPQAAANLATELLVQKEPVPGDAARRALEQLEQQCADDPEGRSSYLVGLAYRYGAGRTADNQ